MEPVTFRLASISIHEAVTAKWSNKPPRFLKKTYKHTPTVTYLQISWSSLKQQSTGPEATFQTVHDKTDVTRQGWTGTREEDVDSNISIAPTAGKPTALGTLCGLQNHTSVTHRIKVSWSTTSLVEKKKTKLVFNKSVIGIIIWRKCTGCNKRVEMHAINTSPKKWITLGKQWAETFQAQIPKIHYGYFPVHTWTIKPHPSACQKVWWFLFIIKISYIYLLKKSILTHITHTYIFKVIIITISFFSLFIYFFNVLTFC